MASCVHARVLFVCGFIASVAADYSPSFLQVQQINSRVEYKVVETSAAQSVHWAFVTDCSAYQFNQGNLLLASALHVNQKGNFTWIVYGCESEQQKDAFNKLPHPRAQAWHSPKTELIDPSTGEHLAHFQASNRPLSVLAWWHAVKPKEDAISIIDPDMFFLHAVEFSGKPEKDAKGPWQTLAPQPKHGTGARYGQGCVPHRWNDATVNKICGSAAQRCLLAKNDYASCDRSYSSGPPWIMHHDDAESILSTFPVTALKVHEAWPDLLSEQVAYGVAQMQAGVESTLDAFWFLSAPTADEQPWNAISSSDWDPCQARTPPPNELAFPPFWHACSTYEIPHLTGKGFRLHKDHIHKDLLDCEAPLIHYPPRDALEMYKKDQSKKQQFRETWSVCTYTNLVNTYATAWKQQFCDKPNLDPSLSYPSSAQSFIMPDGWMRKVFRSGGWNDIDYKVK